MKCEYCAGNLSIENERCPHCDAPNPYFKAHRQDMADYAKRFADTEKDVVKKTNKYTKNTFNIAVCAVLVAVIAILILLVIRADDIAYNKQYRKNTKNAAAIAKVVKSYEDSKDYIGMAKYMNNIYMNTYKNEMTEFNYLTSVASEYSYIVEYMNKMVLKEDRSSSAEDKAKYIARNLDSIYTTRYVTAENSKNIYANETPPYFKQEHLDAMDDMINNIHVMFKAYLKMDDETIASLKDMTAAKRQLLLEEKIGEVFAKYEEEE